MPKHPSFQSIYANMKEQYGEHADEVYYAWVNQHGYDDTKPFPKGAKKMVSEESLFKMFATGPGSRFIKSVEGDSKFYVGVASSTSLDRDNERMAKGVLEKAALNLVGKPVMFNHKHADLGVGKIVGGWMDGERLMIKMQPTEAKSMQDVITQIDEGILSAFSVGGRSLEKTPASDGSYKIIKDADFYEVSVVAIPANPDAQILGAVAKMLDVEKTRIASSVNDDADEVKGDGGEADEKAPVVPHKKKKQKDGSLVTDDGQQEEARRKAKENKGEGMIDVVKAPKPEEEDEDDEDEEEEEKEAGCKEASVDLAKENGPSTPNQPTALVVPEALARFERTMMRALARMKAGKGPGNMDSRGAPSELPSAKKEASEVDLQKSVESMQKEIQELKEKLVKRVGLVQQEEPTKVEAPVAAELTEAYKSAYKAL